MKRIRPELLSRLESKLHLRERQVYERIQRVTSETGLDRYHAAILLAMRNNINVSRYAESEDMAVIRGLPTSQPAAAPSSARTPIRRVLLPAEPVVLDLQFVSNPDLRDILQRDLAELNVARSQGVDKTPKTCMVLAGSVAEALLLDCLQQNEQAAQAYAATMPKRPAANIEDWKLAQMVAVAVGIDKLSSDANSGATQLRDWRNLIHPARAIKEAVANRITPSPGRARSAVSFLQLIAEELGR